MPDKWQIIRQNSNRGEAFNTFLTFAPLFCNMFVLFYNQRQGKVAFEFFHISSISSVSIYKGQ
jgi:hypothetical protein